MISKPRARTRLPWLLAAAAAFPAPAIAQFSTSPAPLPGTVQSTDPGDRLAANLLVLSQNPRDVIALTEAGKSALAIGDGNAALSFFARAEELSPGDSRIKAGIGTALLLMEEPNEALKLYAEAASLGLPDREIARDRGLAFDLLGDPHRAQQDYLLVLKHRNDEEVIRRLAMSYGISGERDRGLKLLDPLLKKQDQAAWRARAFILAMNGNLRDAERIADQVMPIGMGSTMTPFLRRLASLTPAQRARAVNFGSMPETGVRTAALNADSGFRPVDASSGSRLIPPEPEPVQVARLDPKEAARLAKAERRRPGRDSKSDRNKSAQLAVAPPSPAPTAKPANDSRVDSRIDTRINTRIAEVDYNKLPAELRAAVKPVTPPTPAVAPVSAIKPAQIAAVPPPPPVAAPGQSAEPPALFEVPAPKVAITSPPAPPPVAIRPVATLPSAVPVAASVPVVASKPVALVVAPPPPPAVIAPKPVVAPVPPPPPSVVITPPPPAVVVSPPPPVAVAPPPPAVAFSPPPPPVVTITPPSPSAAAQTPPSPVIATPPAPVQIAMAPPPPPTDMPSQPSLMGPPAPPGSPTVGFPPSPSISAATADLIPVAARTEAVEPKPVEVAAAPPSPPPVSKSAPVKSLADIMAGIEPETESAAVSLPSAAQLRATKLAAQKKAAADAEAKAAKDAAAKEAAEKADAAKRNPARVWVQVATGANESGLSGTWKRLKEKAPGVFKGQSASVVPYRSTNRVLVGPFKSQAEARAMLSAMNKAGLQGTTYSSEAGQEVAKIAGR